MRILLLACALVWAGCSSEQGAKGGPGGGGGNGGSGNSVGGSGGSGGKVGVGGEPGKDSGPMWSLDADPNDLTTDHAPDVRIAATDYYGMGAADFSQALSLRTHPADVVVPTSVAKEQSDAGPPPGSKAWVLHPTQTLTPGWYALVVAAGSGAFGQGHPRDDGGWESRFRIGSDPLLLAVEACASDDLTKLVKVRIDFSELVTLPASGTPIDVVVEGQPVSCVVYDPPNEMNLGLGLTCTPPIPATGKVMITVGTGISSKSSGLPLRTSTGPLPQAFDLPEIAPYAACRTWRETQVPID